MRKIASKEKQKSKERFNQLIIGLIFIFLMLLSVFGYSLGSGDNEETSTSDKVVYNGLEFVKSNNYWTLNVQNMRFAFKYNPKEVYKIPGNLSYIDSYVDVPLYIQSEDGEAATEVYMNLEQIAQRIQYACLNESDCEGDYPIKDCSSNFIIIKRNNITSIEQNDGCVFIQGKEEDMLKIVDEFLFKIMGIETE